EQLQDFTAQHYADAKGDLANVFLERCLELNSQGGVTQMVMPQNWLFLGSYKKQREHLLKQVSWDLLARLGAGAFQTPMWDFNVQLLTLTKGIPNKQQCLSGVDASVPKTVQEKAAILESGKLAVLSQAAQLGNPDAIVQLEKTDNSILMMKFSSCYQGTSTGDNPRFIFYFWECPYKLGIKVEYMESVPSSSMLYAGKQSTIKWKEVQAFNGAAIRGYEAYKKLGVSIGQMGTLPATLYLGNRFPNTTPVIIPASIDNLPALWSFCCSKDFSHELRKINQKLSVDNGYIGKIPFDLDHWTKVAQEKYPNGLPKPYSDDPTQWIFHGHPAQSEEPLQVAVARLLGYQWPTESDKDMELSDAARDWIAQCASLSAFVDDDGIVCLSPVRGEKSADERLEALLMAAYGEQWNASLRHKLLEQAKCKGKTLDFWLREKFFEQHCKLFQNRPFIWHLWDGLKDGFSVLVNYHQLDYKNLERLIYTYLGDWIKTQEYGVKEGIDGATLRLQAAQTLKTHLENILEGEKPYDIFVRWKPLEEQAIGWNPDINDGVRMNIRPFMSAPDVGKKDAGILRTKPNIKWGKDRGKDVASAPWYQLGLEYGESEGSRINDHHLTLAEKQAAGDGNHE
ncbi:MAG: hypothetical protein K9L22_03675, partial [Methylococcaceae bacterium]|nr:hypothetical protein [Methylococcaceae bacterium]